MALSPDEIAAIRYIGLCGLWRLIALHEMRKCPPSCGCPGRAS